MNLNPIAEVRIPIKLSDGRERFMLFEANTMCAYEAETGKFFLSTVSDLFDAVFPDGVPPDRVSKVNPLEIMKRVSMTDLRALLWASLHEYNARDDPAWPLTLNQVGKLMQLQHVPAIFSAFLAGQQGNSPSKAEMGESPAATGSTNGTDSPPTIAAPGGERGIALPADALG